MVGLPRRQSPHIGRMAANPRILLSQLNMAEPKRGAVRRAKASLLCFIMQPCCSCKSLRLGGRDTSFGMEVGWVLAGGGNEGMPDAGDGDDNLLCSF